MHGVVVGCFLMKLDQGSNLTYCKFFHMKMTFLMFMTDMYKRRSVLGRTVTELEKTSQLYGFRAKC
jgi:hypothetical protein